MRRGGQRRVLDGGRSAAVYLEDLRVDGAELPGDPGDLTDAGQEAQDVAGTFRQRSPHHRGHVRQLRGIHPHPVRRPHRAGGGAHTVSTG